MEAVVHLDRPAAMPSQSQMSYARTTGLHGRPSQNPERDVRSYKNSPQQHIPVSSHNPGPYSSVPVSNYNPMRYIHPAPYAPPPGATPVPYRENLYTSSRNTPNLVERGNVEFVRNEQIKQRISLLPSNEYMSLSRNRLHQGESYREQMGGPPPPQNSDAPLKKIRLGDPPKPDLQRHLRVDTRDESQPAPTYNPQVEAISPTLPAEVLQDDSNLRSTKDDLLHGIAKVDREITKTELQIAKLKREQQELEEAAKKPATATEEEEIPLPKHQSPAQKIYADNRKKAHDAHMLLANLGPKIDLPLYNQPSDTAVYHENKKRHSIFRKRLHDHLRKKHIEREAREKHLTTTYSQMVQDWLKKVEKIENSQKRKAKEAKNREFFEKVFPKLRKQREDRERFNRVGARVKSEADIEEIMDGLQEQEMEDKKMRSYAVVPPLLLDAKQRSIYYVNNNGRLDDFAAEYKERQLLNVWSQSEKEIFKDKYLQHPKNFGAIATYLIRKDVCDCVQHYYLSKKTVNYKRLLRRSRQRQRSRNPQSKVNSVSVPNNNLDILTTASGVTTRLQREQLQKQEPLPTTVATECDSHSSFIMEQSQQPPLLIPGEEKSEKKKEDKEEKKKKDDEESTDEENIEIGGDMENVSGIACAICKTESVCSRALPRSQASQYGLKEEEVPADARVCNLCRCKAVRSRFTNCPIRTCPNAKGHRVKRLRPLPCKWLDLAPSIKEPIAAEFQIDDTVTKCCSVCFNRISRRIGVGMDIGSSVGDEGQLVNSGQCGGIFLQWSDEDIESLKKAIKMHGLHWEQVSQMVGKSQHQCMNFYFNQQHNLGLDELMFEEKTSSEERKPVLTDEEESGSSTSSCDEVGTGGVADTAGDSDTTSAPSPRVNPEPMISDDVDKMRQLTITPPPPQIVDESRERTSHSENTEHSQSTSSPQPKSSSASLPPTLYPAKEDYDSSATETADEGQGGGETEISAARASTPKREEDPSSPLTVKDLMLGVIEMQLMKNQGQVQPSSTPGAPPTISSILKSDHHSISSYNSQREKNTRSLDVGRDSLATVSVVNTHHTHQPVQEMPKEGLVVVPVQQAMREPPGETEGVTLDLSIKKPRDSSGSQGSKLQHQMSSQNPVFRVSQPPESQGFFHQPVLASGSMGPKLSPGVISASNTSTSTSKAQCGSIIHGTPVSSPNIYSQSRYEQPPSSLIHQVSSQHKESGSITQGTPVHQRGSLYPNPEYFQKRNIPSNSGYFSPRPSSYNVEQRQIIMNDYITSQQMHGPGNSSAPRSSRDKMYFQGNTRQGVIQRHNTKPPSPGVSHYPPGHEAFSSLVDVAVRQPSLPVPPSSVSMPHEHKNIQDEKRHLHEGLGERFNRDSPHPHERYSSRESERYMRDSLPPKSHNQQQSSRDQPPQQQMREPVTHSSRESYQPPQHHLDREVQQQMQRDHRDREHHSQQSQKIRDSHISHVGEMRVGRPPLPGFQQRIMHESHHPIDQRLIQNPSFREQPTSSQPSNTSSRTHSSQEQSSESQNSRVRCPENSTLTAASLIDAIITHQINQSSEAQTTSVPSGTTTTPQSQPTRPGDRLFQSFHRDCSESNGKLSPVKSSDSSKSHSVPPQSIQAQIIDHTDMYNNPVPTQGMRPSIYQGYDHQTWKLRRALQQKEDQGNVIDKTDEHMSRFYQDPNVPLSPLDYVKNRIAEVMRTSEEESVTGKDNESPSGDGMQDEGDHGGSHSTSHASGHPTSHSTSHSTVHPTSHPTNHPSAHSAASTFLTQSHTYAYPYSALSLNPSAPSSVPLPSMPTTKVTESSIPEPAPLLSAQYEPLSDED